MLREAVGSAMWLLSAISHAKSFAEVTPDVRMADGESFVKQCNACFGMSFSQAAEASL